MARMTALCRTLLAHCARLLRYIAGLTFWPGFAAAREPAVALGQPAAFAILTEEMGRRRRIAGVNVRSRQGQWLKRSLTSWSGMDLPALKAKVEAQMAHWFLERGISNRWIRWPAGDIDTHRAIYYKFDQLEPWTAERMMESTRVYSGTFLHDVWSVTDHNGRLIAPCNEHGAECHAPGAYCTPNFLFAISFAWATVLFNDCMFHGAVWDIAVDTRLAPHHERNAGEHNHQLFVTSDRAQLIGLWIVADKSVKQGEQRFYS